MDWYLTQARKKKVLEEVRRQRQRRTIISVVIVAVLIGTIGYGVYALTQSKDGGDWPFPCGAESNVVHVHPWLRIYVNTGTDNVSVSVPQYVDSFRRLVLSQCTPTTHRELFTSRPPRYRINIL